MTAKHTVKLTANFERNLEELEAFVVEAGAPHDFDALLNELTDTVIPNLESFPGMGRLFLDRPARSVEVANGVARLTKQLGSLARDGELREYVMAHYLLPIRRLTTLTRQTVASSIRSEPSVGCSSLAQTSRSSFRKFSLF